ncbi:MAG: DNA glycosylase [Verrucomicrobiota bacterium]
MSGGYGAGGFDLEATLNSGQVFHWEAVEGGEDGLTRWVGVVGDRGVWVCQDRAGEVRISDGDEGVVREYLGLNDTMEEIFGSFPRGDRVLEEAVAFCPGLRIIRQPAWECLATFITSSLKQVAHIREISLKLRRRFGERAGTFFGREVWAYPEPGALAAAGEASLRACGMGYRAKGLHRAASAIASGEVDLGALGILGDEDLRERLCEFYGVGEKIANCVMLFGFGRLGAFPIDVWIERILREHYWRRMRGRKASLARVQSFAEGYFGANRGYAQQYLYHWGRHGGDRGEGVDGAVG